MPSRKPVDYFARKLVDSQDNLYVVEMPLDINPQSVEDIMLGAQEGLVKLRAYRLKGDVYRTPDNQIMGEDAKAFNAPFYKKLLVYDPDQSISEEEFQKGMLALLDKHKKDSSKIGKVRVTSWHNNDVFYDEKEQPYIKKELPCAAKGCEVSITGRQSLSLDLDGNITRPQQFRPDDSGVTRARRGSKRLFCSRCSVKHIEPPAPPTPAPVSEEPATPPIEKKVEKKPAKDAFEVMAELAKPGSAIDPQYFMGYVYGVLSARKGE